MTAEPSMVGREHWTHKGAATSAKIKLIPVDYEQVEKDAKSLKTRFNEIYQ